jgi:5'-3' exonuclease
VQSGDTVISFGVGKNLRYINVRTIMDSIGPPKANALPLFHALTGCDTVSGFAGRGKKTAWSTWRSFPDLADVLLQLTTDSNDLPESSLDTIDRFVILLYDRTNTFSQLDEARRKLFLRRRSPLRLPPISGAIRQHVKSTSRWSHMGKLFEPHTRHS